MVDVSGWTIEVQTDPGDGAYRHIRLVRAGESIHLQAFPDVEIAVSDVLR